jgi:hypothetical protein
MKGQWYLIAGILISFSLISFFFVYYSYSTIDFTSILKNREDNLALNINFALDRTIDNAKNSDNKLADIGDLLELFKSSMIRRGYLVEYSYTTSGINLTFSGNNMKVKITR